LSTLINVATSAFTTILILALVRILSKAWLDRQLERLKNELEGEMDLLTRRRDVYAELANAMRVFQRSQRQWSAEERTERGNRFLKAYDEACLWASEPVIETVGVFLDLVLVDERSHGQTKGTEERKQKAYAACMEEMRKDSGFSNTGFKYRIVGFD
jgi:hypothetical protein